MKIAVFSDIHDNLVRWQEAAEIIKVKKIKIGICCGDLADLEVLDEVTKSFEKLYLCFGNFDYKLRDKTGLFPENVEWFETVGEFMLENRKIAIVHYDYEAKELAKSGEYEVVFYGHSHTPWEKKVGNTIMLNPGEIAGQFGKPTFAIYDLKVMTAELEIIR